MPSSVYTTESKENTVHIDFLMFKINIKIL